MPNMKIHLRPEALFFVQYDPKATWFDQQKPAFGLKIIFLKKKNTPPPLKTRLYRLIRISISSLIYIKKYQL